MGKQKGLIRDNKYGIKKKPDRIKFYEYAEEFLREREEGSRKSPNTLKIDRCKSRMLNLVFKGYNLSDITFDMIKRYRIKRKQEVSVGTCNRDYTLSRCILRRAVGVTY